LHLFAPHDEAPLIAPGNDLASQAAPSLFSPITWTSAANGLPILNSLPGAPTAVYLDFDGDTGTNTQPYSEDADATTFNATEQANIVEAWRQLAAYYAIFDTNVTTQATSLPKAWEVIGNNAGGATGGYAYVSTFPNNSPQAFNTSSNARSRESGMAHEIGHVFGLQHQSQYDLLGNKTAEYISAPDPLHGPIMGVDYSGTVHKFIIGHPSNSPGTLQDDLAVIAGKIKAREAPGGDGFRHDDFPNTIATASPLSDDGAGMQYASGIIERMSDADAFSFVASGGPVAIAAVADKPSALDAKLEIFDADGNRLATADGPNNDQQLTMTLPAGTYYALVSSHGDYDDLGMYDLSVRALPAGWSGVDIGTTGVVGYSGYDAATGTFANAGGGSDITGTTDHFHYTYQTLNGDGEIVARVTQVQNTATASRVGLDIRDSGTANNLRHAAIVLTPSGGAEFIYRTGVGGTAVTVTGSSNALPRWLRLVRSGNTLTGYVSDDDGVTWTQVGSTTINQSASVSIGLLTTAGTTSKLNEGRFDSVTITGDTTVAPPVFNALPAPTNLAVTPAPSGTGLALSWDDVPDSIGFVVQRSSDGVTFSQIVTLGAGVTTYNDPNPGVSMRYFYRVAARDASGNSPWSDVASAVNRPGPPTGLAITAWNTSSLVLNWKDVSGDSGYRIERSSDGVNFSTLATVGTNVPSYTNTGLASGQTYYYRVITLSPEGDSTASTAANGATRLGAVTGEGFNNIAPYSVTIHWSDLPNEGGYRIERSVTGTSWQTLANVGANVLTYTDPTVSPLRSFYYRVIGTAGSAVSLDPTAIFTATPAPIALPAPWTATDLGTVYGGGRGASGLTNGTFTLVSGGSDIGGTADSFHYTYQPLVGDGQIVARVLSIDNTDANAKVGIMIRAALNAGSQNVAVLLTQGSGVLLQSRAANNATTTTTTVSGIAAPYWLKLVRAGSTFTGFYSTDGTAWTQVGAAVTITMPTSVTIGIASTSHDTATLGTATVSDVSLSNRGPSIVTAASASPANVTSGSTTDLSVLGADDHGEAYLSYLWTVTAAPDGAPSPTFVDNGTNGAKNTTAHFYQGGDYEFTVTITDTQGQSITSRVSVSVSSVFPRVLATSFDYHRSLAYTFNEDVSASLTVDDLEVKPAPGGDGVPPITPISVDWNADTRTATFTFNNDFADGDYVATLFAAGITDGQSMPLSTDLAYAFFAMAGDVNRDRSVDFNDLVLLAQNYNTTGRAWSDGDLTGDGTIDFNDLVILAQEYNTTLPPIPAASAAPVAAPSAVAPVLANVRGSSFSRSRISLSRDADLSTPDVLNASARPPLKGKPARPSERRRI
jgi:hypothetical protein